MFVAEIHKRLTEARGNRLSKLRPSPFSFNLLIFFFKMSDDGYGGGGGGDDFDYEGPGYACKQSVPKFRRLNV